MKNLTEKGKEYIYIYGKNMETEEFACFIGK